MSDEKQAELTSEINPENLTDEPVDELTATTEEITGEISEEAKEITRLREELAARVIRRPSGNHAVGWTGRVEACSNQSLADRGTASAG